eukprot:TRINITY_DN80267_c0_g1_i1.p1 TRINITY_DN80267_c0_g1~~TRINITY_DN80267_c0_g1_i1.p1  ORF type:complete len:245 (-),score=92.15 TRINITY_DN80267_c0_g1_i1:13-747(-)
MDGHEEASLIDLPQEEELDGRSNAKVKLGGLHLTRMWDELGEAMRELFPHKQVVEKGAEAIIKACSAHQRTVETTMTRFQESQRVFESLFATTLPPVADLNAFRQKLERAIECGPRLFAYNQKAREEWLKEKERRDVRQKMELEILEKWKEDKEVEIATKRRELLEWVRMEEGRQFSIHHTISTPIPTPTRAPNAPAPPRVSVQASVEEKEPQGSSVVERETVVEEDSLLIVDNGEEEKDSDQQ